MPSLVSRQTGVVPRVNAAAAYGAGKFDQAVTTPLLEGTAVDTFIRPGSSGPLTTGTIEAWVKSTATTLRVAFSHPGWYWLGHNASGRVMLDYGYGGVNVTLTGTTATLNDGNWHHVAVVFQSGAASVYVDGTRDGTSSSTPDGDTGVTDHFVVGGLWDAADFDWTGSIDDVRLSNTARYTGASFTAPTARHTVDGNTVHAWRLDGDLTEAVAEAPPTPVSATTPTKLDVSGTGSDTYTIPVKAGVEYRIDGVAKAAGTYPTAGATSVTITAVATSGYTLTGTSSWTLTFDITDAPPGIRFRLAFEPLVWDGSGYPDRHPGAKSVTYIGPEQPADWQENDMWVSNS